jgi:ABC-type multidrug transport system ATPase subunit
MLCGKDGSIDLTDLLKDEIQGPASFKCNGKDCAFSEPAMDDLISAVFGDDSIFLSCNSGECLHYTMVPGFERGERPINWIMIGSGLGGVAVFLILVSAIVTYLAKGSTKHPTIQLADDETGKLMSEHTPVDFTFDNIGYTLPNAKHPLLVNATGRVKSGEVLAIMGPSGAGKTTLLDILANRTKMGHVTGNLYVNGRQIPRDEYAGIIGYVDQEDTMIPTLTVYETILYSALLRLPRSMSTAAKKYRVMEVMQELNIDGIKDSRIGQAENRSISGGERRRVAIACELVTSPSILFLDEPTSGLDAYNAFNVIECLVTLARNYKRTVVFTIHQPRSNIVTLFDHLVLLAKGRTIYSGSQSRTQTYFGEIGYRCPPGFNIADYLIDLTMGAIKHDDELNAEVDIVIEGADTSSDDDGLTPHLRKLSQEYEKSSVHLELREEITQMLVNNNSSGSSEISSGDTTAVISSPKRPGVLTQFRILSNRTFKNLYRNPMLMFAHYAIAVVLALVCGGLFYQVSNTIAGFQNRMGLFFFYEALLGFMCLTSLQVFSTERILFIRERANGYYSPGTYFFAKVLFDIIPLRVVPPLMMGLISYYMVGLVEGVDEFLKFLLVLVLFNLTAAALCLAIGVVFKNLSMANLISVLVMLFSMLFAGLLLNKGKKKLQSFDMTTHRLFDL